MVHDKCTRVGKERNKNMLTTEIFVISSLPPSSPRSPFSMKEMQGVPAEEHWGHSAVETMLGHQK